MSLQIVDLSIDLSISKEELFDFLKKKLSQYDVKYLKTLYGKQILVSSGAWYGGLVAIKTGKDKHRISIADHIPNHIVRALFGGLITYLFSRSGYLRLEEDIVFAIEEKYKEHIFNRSYSKRIKNNLDID